MRDKKERKQKRGGALSAVLLLAAVMVLAACGQTEGEKPAAPAVSSVQTVSSAEGGSASEKSSGEKDAGADISKDVFAMDTYMTLRACGPGAEAAVDAGIAEIERLDALLSTGSETSEVSKLNREKSLQVSDDVFTLVTRAGEIAERTDGLFDIAIYPVMRAWGFTDQNFRVPADAELAELLNYADPANVLADETAKTVTLAGEHTEIDLGGIAKGYTSARVMEIFRSYGVNGGMVSLGGNVQTTGTKNDGALWKIGVQNPDPDGEMLGVLTLTEEAVITSGGYERCFEENGIVYHHIVDPRTGYPADSGLSSVTIVSGDGTLADGLSTAVYIMGLDAAEDLWRKTPEEFGMILFDTEGVLHVTENLAECFAPGFRQVIIEK